MYSVMLTFTSASGIRRRSHCRRYFTPCNRCYKTYMRAFNVQATPRDIGEDSITSGKEH